MHVAFILGGSLVGAGALLYLHHVLVGVKAARNVRAESTEPFSGGAKNDSTVASEKLSEALTAVNEIQTEPGECCGMHITCEKDSLSPVFSPEIEYFDDEELDIYANIDIDDYTDEDIERFRDVLLTLQPEDIAPWARSIQLRGIALPEEVRDELFMMVEEARNE